MKLTEAKKKQIVKAVARAIPKNWSYKIQWVRGDTASLTILSAPIDFNGQKSRIDHYSLDKIFTGDLLEIMAKIMRALNCEKYIKGEYGYISNGHYLNIDIGTWNKPLVIA